MSHRGFVGAASLLLYALGCGRSGPTAEIVDVEPVSGVLTYQGKPLEYFQVTFYPTDGRRPAAGVTDGAGKFTLGTNEEGDGAPPGPCKVSIAFVGPPMDDAAAQANPIDNPAFLPRPPIVIPAKYASPETSGLTQDVPDGGASDLKIELN